MNEVLFRQSMKNNKDSIVKIAKELNVTRQTLYYKLKHGFTNEEIEFFKNRWSLTPIGVDKIFIGGEKNDTTK